jgi:GNAT superfamily N-acetyltransferase
MNTDTVRISGSTVRIATPALSAIPVAMRQPMATVAAPAVNVAPVVIDPRVIEPLVVAPRTVEPRPVEQRPAAPPPVERRRMPTSRSLRPTGDIVIREVTTRHDREAFSRFPWKIYEGDKNWSPPLLLEVKAFIDRKTHPFYLHGDATQFLAYDQGQLVGRILVSDDPNYNEQHGTNVGCFGMFECIDDEDTSTALLNAAANWLRDRGRTEMMGPIDYSTNYPCGLLIEGFDTPQRVMMNHNPPYYARLFENWRLTKAKDLYAWWFDDSCDMLHKWAKRAAKFAARSGTKVRPLDFKNFAAEVARCHEVYNLAWEKSWGFVKMTEAEFLHLASELKKYAVQDLVLLAEVDGEPAGVCITLPDFNQATRPLNGRLTTWGLPIGLVRLLYNMRHITCARLAVLGVVEKFRRRGVAEMFILQTLAKGLERGYTGAELGWTLEDNDLINRTIEKVGGQRYKTFRLYHTSL